MVTELSKVGKRFANKQQIQWSNKKCIISSKKVHHHEFQT